ncbi:MAG: Uma2 family endonuclease [Armatimonadota bacterium]|nr:Uma2 family endonuclease [Armatimonadota bacterium]
MLYEQAGVKEYWLIDPDRRQVEFHVLNAQGVYQQAFAGAEGEYSRYGSRRLLDTGGVAVEPPPDDRGVSGVGVDVNCRAACRYKRG